MNSKLFSAGGIASFLLLLALCTGLLAYGVTEEVPIGSVQGTAVMSESGKPLKGAVVVLRPTFDIPDWEGLARSVKSDAKGSFAFRNIPAGSYAVEAYTEAHTLAATNVSVVEGQTSNFDLSLQPTAPYLELYASQHVFSPSQKASLQARGFATESALTVSVYEVKFESIAKKRGLYQVLSPLTYENPQVDPDRSPDFTRVKQTTWPIKNRNDEGIFDEYVTLEGLPEGIYWVRTQAGARQRGTWVMISKIALVTKSTLGATYAFVTDLESGKPVPGATIRYAQGEALMPAGMTGADGTLKFQLPARAGDDVDRNNAVLASVGPSQAICTFYDYSREDSGPAKIWTYSERPVYRPGDEVNFKAIVRQRQGDNYRLPPAGNAKVEIKDPNETVMQTLTLPVSSRGTLHGSFRLPKDVVGDYSVTISYLESEDTLAVEAMAYRKPEFQITVTPLEKSYIRGDKVKFRVKCEYYFGGPVVGADLDATVLRSPDWGYYGDPDMDEEVDYSDSTGDYVTNLQAKTDGNGEAILEYDTGKDEPSIYDYNDQRLTFEVYGTESGDKYFEGKGSTIVRRGDLSIDIQQDSFIVVPGVPINLKLAAVKGDGETPAEGTMIVVESGYERWTKNQSEFIREDVQNLKTGPDGTAEFKVAPTREGSFVIKASTSDRRGNIIKAEAWVYVSRGQTGGWGGPAPDMQVVLDKRQYVIGNTATALLRTKSPGGSAWLTVESNDIHWSKVIPLTSEVTTVQIPVDRAFAPNAQVVVAYVKDRKFFRAERNLSIDLSEKKLKVTITPNAEVTEPGKTVSYKIKTETMDGRPVPADLSLGVVDESIYAIRPDTDDPVKAFYPMRSHSVETSYSFPELYLDGGDKSGAYIEIRKKFLDTAFWEPEIQTDANGEATVDVPLPDNLTSWRATVMAFSADTQVGKSTVNVKARKPLMIRLSTPGYMVQGDQVRITASIHNDTGSAQSVEVQMKAEGVTLAGAATQKIEAPTSEPVVVAWTATAGEAGKAKVTVTARGSGGQTDGMESTFDVRTHGRPLVKYETGELRDRASLTVTHLDGAVEGEAKLVVTPSLASGFLATINELVDYPYGCTEQTMSRFMPAVVVAKTLRDLKMPRPDLDRKIPEVVRRSLVRLRKLQHYDGGFGWWENDQSEPGMTALVLEGLAQSRDAGLATDPFIRDNAIRWAKQQLAEPRKLTPEEVKDYPYLAKRQREGLVFLAYAVSLHETVPAATDTLKRFCPDPQKPPKEGDRLSAAALAEMAVALNRLSVSNVTLKPFQDRALAALRGMANVSGSVASWPEDWGVVQTARAFSALVKLAPTDPLITKSLRYLMLARRGGTWFSTEDTAQVLVGLSGYLRATKELAANYRVVVSLNGKPIKEYSAGPGNLFAEVEPVVLPIRDLPAGDNTLEMTKTGPGVGYYSLEVKQVPPTDQIGALLNGSGMTLTRTYHSLSARPMEDGTLRLLPNPRPQTTFASGDLMRCVITIKCERDFQFVMIEAPTAANSRVAESEYLEEWNWWFSGMSILDDRVVFFARYLQKGEHKIEYTLRAETPGTASALPAVVSEMYAPDTNGSCAENRIEVSER